MKKSKVKKADKLLVPSSTTGSTGVSTSSNLTIESAETIGDDKTADFPVFHEEKDWTDKTIKFNNKRDM